MLLFSRLIIIGVEVAHIDTMKILESMKADGVKIESHCLNGEYQKLCNLLGYEAVEKLYLHYYGGYLNLPKKLFVDDFVHSYIVRCYRNGRDAKEMAREYGYTYSWVMKLVRRARVNNKGVL